MYFIVDDRLKMFYTAQGHLASHDHLYTDDPYCNLFSAFTSVIMLFDLTDGTELSIIF